MKMGLCLKKRKTAAALILFVAAVCFCAAPRACAAEGDLWVDIYFDHGGEPDLLGTGFYRSGALWAPADVLRVMGVSLEDGPGGKGFVITVDDPAAKFGSRQIKTLAGGALDLYFPSAQEEGVSYFNVSGMEKLIGLAYEDEGGHVTFRSAEAGNYGGTEPQRDEGTLQGKLTLAWEHVVRDNPDLSTEEKIHGLDVLSPTWFNLSDANGGVANRASAAYAEAARAKGYKLWALVSNSFNAGMTSSFFKNQMAQRLFVARLIAYAKIYGLDGINVDFEGMSDEHRAPFARFFAYLANTLRAEGLTVSVDVFIPANTKSSRSHDRKTLAAHADYVMLMAYDEHWRSCPRAGSVASLPWVVRAVEGALAEGVPSGKLVLGVPFYMRRWEERGSGSKLKVKSYTLTMEEAENLAAKKGAMIKWLPGAGQNYFSYTENGIVNKIWVEDARSIAAKLDLVAKYGLAGMAGWRKGHEKSELWETIAESMGKNER